MLSSCTYTSAAEDFNINHLRLLGHAVNLAHDGPSNVSAVGIIIRVGASLLRRRRDAVEAPDGTRALELRVRETDARIQDIRGLPLARTIIIDVVPRSIQLVREIANRPQRATLRRQDL